MKFLCFFIGHAWNYKKVSDQYPVFMHRCERCGKKPNVEYWMMHSFTPMNALRILILLLVFAYLFVQVNFIWTGL